MTDESAFDDAETEFEFWDDPIDTEWLNIGEIGYHDGEFILYDQPEANGVRLNG